MWSAPSLLEAHLRPKFTPRCLKALWMLGFFFSFFRGFSFPCVWNLKMSKEDMEMLVPPKVCYRVACYKRADEAIFESHKLYDPGMGWEKAGEDEVLEPIWTIGPILSPSLIEVSAHSSVSEDKAVESNTSNLSVSEDWEHEQNGEDEELGWMKWTLKISHLIIWWRWVVYEKCCCLFKLSHWHAKFNHQIGHCKWQRARGGEMLWNVKTIP